MYNHVHTWIHEKINKAHSILGIMRRNLTFLDEDSFLVIYKSIVCFHREYANCTLWSPHTVQDKKKCGKCPNESY